MASMNSQTVTPVEVPPWSGYFGVKETVYYADEVEARVEVQYELVPSYLYVYVLSTAVDGEDEPYTRYRVREVRPDASGFIQTEPSYFSPAWPWDQISRWPSKHPLEATLWLDTFRTSMAVATASHCELLAQWLRGEVSSYYVKSLYVRPQL